MTDATIGIPPEPEDDVLGAEQDTVNAPVENKEGDVADPDNGGPAGVEGADHGVGMAEPVGEEGE